MTRLTVYRGEAKVWTFTATNNGAALDLTGAAVYFAARLNYPLSSETTDTAANIALSTASGIALTTPASGVFTVTLTKANTNTLTPAVYLYGIEAVLLGATDPVTLGVGELEILSDVVRAV
jgi:hypothetical protein